ncbi:CPBP family intramembrane glutamic endopeptidase [Rubrobacter indicoceani]|uniref:CPBP family intramembrane glutamic endopeptidase n=1 Tax=Rubrobacter indicoceani TaxID=2051957 RepID=UPI000E5AC0C1|nr:CPBP family intramembrane glutamic endopeptidase [Rubrobacter indicoceani]
MEDYGETTEKPLRNEPDHPRLIRSAVLLYGSLGVISFVWIAMRDLGLPLYEGGVLSALLLGASGGGALLAFGAGLGRLVPTVRRLAGEMSKVITAGASPGALLFLALLSGVFEELFFRAVLQREFGLVAASVVFGLVHFVPERRFLFWTAYAVAAGFFLGSLYEFTGGVAAPMVAHMLNNAVVLLYWKYRPTSAPAEVPADRQ